MSTPNPDYPIHELRVALTTSDYEGLVKFYCDGLGIEAAQFWDNWQGRGLILDLGNATMEIFDEKQAETVDQIEAGRHLSG
jgi:lactoylglutathione lyase